MVPVEKVNPVAGYYTISAGELNFHNYPLKLRRLFSQYPIPIARIGELAVEGSLH